jgi:hypothetical protein
MLIHGFTVIPIKLGEISHSKSTWVRDSVIVFRIRLLMGSRTSLGREPKLSQCSSDLVPNPFRHSTLTYSAGSRLVKDVTRSPGKHHVRHWSMWHPISHGRDVWTVGDGLIKMLMQIRITTTAMLVDVNHWA